MYRIRLEVKERRRQRRHPQYAKPELLATGPNQFGHGTSPSSRVPSSTSMWFWISSDVVGWMVAKGFDRPELLQAGIVSEDLTLHADQGRDEFHHC